MSAHPSSAILNAFTAGTLDPTATEAVLAHLNLCPQCNAIALTFPPELRDHSQYEVLRELDRGGMGVVYLVKHCLSQRTEVLKVISPHLLADRVMKERFLREI